jgi:hypothetical protein
MPELPTLVQTIYFYGAIAAFALFWVALFIAWISVTVLPGKTASRPASARIGADASHAA